jgi:hypothetical protein
MTRISTVSVALSSSIVFCVAFALLLPAAARAADCPQWDVSGDLSGPDGPGLWTVIQTNGWNVNWNLRQAGTGLQGDASTFTPKSSEFGNIDGYVQGNIIRNDFSVTVRWKNGKASLYKGTVDSQGRLKGVTYAVNPTTGESIGPAANWESDPRYLANCIAAFAKEPSGKIKGLGKRRFPPPAGKIQGLGKQKFKTATAANDVNIHDGPGGNFNIKKCPGGYDGNCIMRKDETAPILDFHPDGWYQLKLDVPGGAGWVAEDHLALSAN